MTFFLNKSGNTALNEHVNKFGLDIMVIILRNVLEEFNIFKKRITIIRKYDYYLIKIKLLNYVTITKIKR